MNNIGIIISILQKHPNLVKSCGWEKGMTVWEIRGRLRYHYRKGCISQYCVNKIVDMTDEEIIKLSNIIKEEIDNGTNFTKNRLAFTEQQSNRIAY